MADEKREKVILQDEEMVKTSLKGKIQTWKQCHMLSY